MKTLESIQNGQLHIPMSASWYLSDLGKAQGTQDLFVQQSPQRLNVLREHDIAQSAVSSNRIEGVEIDRNGGRWYSAIRQKDRDGEVAGYRDALNTIHHAGATMPVASPPSWSTDCRGRIWLQKYKEQPVDIIRKLAGGGGRIRFSVSRIKLQTACKLVSRNSDGAEQQVVVLLGVQWILLPSFRGGYGLRCCCCDGLRRPGSGPLHQPGASD